MGPIKALNKLIFLIIFCLINLNLYSQVIVFSENDSSKVKFSLLNKAIPKFDEIMGFTDKILLLRHGNNYSYYSIDGECIYKSNADLAYPFRNGIGKVIINSIPILINKKGEVIFKRNYLKNIIVNPNSFTLISKDDKYGLMNLNFDIILDTVYQYISNFNDGRAIIQKEGYSFLLTKKSKYDSLHQTKDIALIDEKGNFNIEFGRYININFLSQKEYQAIDSDWNFINIPKYNNDIFNEKKDVKTSYESAIYDDILEIHLEDCSNNNFDSLSVESSEKKLRIFIPEKYHTLIEDKERGTEYVLKIQAFHKESNRWINLARIEDYYFDHFLDYKSIKLCSYITNNIYGTYYTKVKIIYSNSLNNEKVLSNIIEVGLNYNLFLVDRREVKLN